MWAGSSQGQGQGSPHGQAAAKAKAKACSSQGQGSPPWACSIQGLGMQQAGSKAKAPRPRHAAKAMACLRGHAGMPLVAGSKAPGGAPACTLPEGPWQHGVGTRTRRGHAPWVGCQGRGMPLGPLKGHGSTWGECCCQAQLASLEPSYGKNPNMRNPLQTHLGSEAVIPVESDSSAIKV
ncbi:hypothetical protein CMV_017075 [Castanea mollissima]|uniref:Uncharacterized protein n=1 Tax=Castanea mollissima TaxID=60419 RepID=A0A8J4QT63_9ROSI|nr:hypothetical protein CMV_017075 [Castanea mollissima]